MVKKLKIAYGVSEDQKKSAAYSRIMEELFGELEMFTEFPNRKNPKTESAKHISNLKYRIDICRKQVIKCRELLENLGTSIPKNGPYG